MLVFQVFSFYSVQIQKYFDPIMNSSSLPGRAGGRLNYGHHVTKCLKGSLRVSSGELHLHTLYTAIVACTILVVLLLPLTTCCRQIAILNSMCSAGRAALLVPGPAELENNLF